MRTSFFRLLPVALIAGICAACVAPLAAFAESTAREITKDNHRYFILENETLRFLIDPATGRTEEAVLKPVNKNLSSQTGRFIDGGCPNFGKIPQAGFFGERIEGFSGPMSVTLKEAGPNRAALELAQQGSRPPEWNVTFTKTISLDAGSPTVRVAYSFVNTGRTPVTIALQPNSGIVFPGGKEPAEDSWYYFPAPEGFRRKSDPATIPGTPDFRSSYFIECNPSRSWLGVQSASGLGISVRMDGRLLDCLFAWCDKFPGSLMDWSYNAVPVEPGKPFETSYTMTFYSGLPSPSPGDAMPCSGLTRDLLDDRATSWATTPKVGAPYWSRIMRPQYDPMAIPLPDHYAALDLETVTPHITWMKPNAMGRVKVMFVSQPDYFKYSVRELFQRFDIEPEFTLVYPTPRVGVSTLPEYRADCLKNLDDMIASTKDDVAYLSDVNWNWVPKETMAKLLDRIEKGLGVVVTGNPEIQKLFMDAVRAHKAQSLNADNLYAGAPLLRSQKEIYLDAPELCTLGAGRVVFIGITRFLSRDYDHFLPSAPLTFADGYPWWEHVYGLFGRAILWAGGKDASAILVPVEADASGAKVVVKTPVASVRVFVTDNKCNVIAEQTAALREGAVSCAWKAPLVQGTYTLGAIALDAKGASLGFGATMFRVEQKMKIDISLDKEFTRGVDRPVAKFSVSSPEPVKARVEAKLVDSFGRTIYLNAREADLGATAAAFSDDMKGVQTVARGHRLVVDVHIVNGVRVASAEKALRIFPAKNRVEDDFVGMAWATFQGVAPYLNVLGRRLNEMGVDYGYAAGNTDRPQLGVDQGFDFYGLNLPVYGIGYLHKFDNATKIATPSPWDDAYFAKIDAEARGNSEKYVRELAVDNYLLQDEFRLNNMIEDHSEGTLKAFRAFLQNDYGTVERLNGQWETKFAKWDAIGYPDKQNPSAWSDWEIFWCGWLPRALQTVHDAIQRIDPNVRVGMSGTASERPAAGMDFWLLTKHSGFYSRYNHFQQDYMPSFSESVVQGQWNGYGSKSEGRARYDLWTNLLTGGHMSPYWQLNTFPMPNYDMGFIDGALALKPYYQFVGDEMPHLREGLGKLVIACSRDNDPIAIYHSIRSNVLNQDQSYPFMQLLADCGFGFTFIDSRDVLAGELQKRGIRAVILAQTACISEAECDALKAFVASGGLLITDHDCGLRDGHAKPWKTGPILDPLFGIRRDAAFQPANQVAVFAGSKDAPERLRGYSAMQIAAARQGLALGTATAWLRSPDGTPAVLINRVGKGSTVYLNLDINNYAETSREGVAGEVSVEQQGVEQYLQSCMTLMQTVLADLGGLTSRVTARVGGRQPTGTRTYYFKSGDLRLAAVLSSLDFPDRIDPKQTVSAKFTLPAKSYVYELRAAPKYFGLVNTVETALSPCIPTFFALLPYKVAEVQMTAPVAARRGEVTTVQGRIVPEGEAKPVLHAIRLEVFAPDGRKFEAFSANLLTSDGKFARELPWAVDEQTGKWRIVATDVISKLSAFAQVEIR